MTTWPLEDPSPDSDLPSDVTFGAWLLTCVTEKVALDRESRVNPVEHSILTYLRLRPQVP